MPGESHGQRSLAGRGPWGRRESDTTELTEHSLLYSWASLVAQTVKNLHVMQETWVPSLGQEDPLEKGVATHSSILAWRIPILLGSKINADGDCSHKLKDTCSLEEKL